MVNGDFCMSNASTKFWQTVLERCAHWQDHGNRQELVGQVIGRHSQEEIHARGIRDMNALADFLREKPFFMEKEPGEIDASVYGDCWPTFSRFRSNRQSRPKACSGRIWSRTAEYVAKKVGLV